MVGILIVTHNHIGEEMLKSAEVILAKKLTMVRTVAIPGDVKAAELGLFADHIKQSIEHLDQGDGVLIITDMPGATPSNLAHYFARDHQVIILTGLNLPMLIRIVNYEDQPLELLAKVGIVGANKGITEQPQP